MKEHPILFSATMVQAILSSQKTQTRRMMNPPPPTGVEVSMRQDSSGFMFAYGHEKVQLANLQRIRWECPYGQPGEKLWVREPHYRFGHWEPVSGMLTKIGRQKWQFVEDGEEVLYEPPTVFRKGRHRNDSATPAWHKRQAMFMPRIASRITLEVVSVRVQRLQDITDDDAWSEGIDFEDYSNCGGCRGAPVAAYSDLWNHINGVGSWDANPWVWVVEFKRIDISA